MPEPVKTPTYNSWSEEEIADHARVQPAETREAAKDASKELREINLALDIEDAVK